MNIRLATARIEASRALRGPVVRGDRSNSRPPGSIRVALYLTDKEAHLQHSRLGRLRIPT